MILWGKHGQWRQVQSATGLDYISKSCLYHQSGVDHESYIEKAERFSAPGNVVRCPRHGATVCPPIWTCPPADEGTAAHIWQILMAGQIPIIVFFAIRWLPRTPKDALLVLVLQGGAALMALAPVFLLRF